MINFEYYVPTKVVFGKDTHSQVGKLIKSYNYKKILLHYGGNFATNSGLLDIVEQSLQASKIEYIKLGGVVPNPELGKVYEGIKICKENNIDFILAVGGGSVIDSSKTIAVGALADYDVWDTFSKHTPVKDALPIGSILTIAAAGSEMSSSAVITKEDGLLKLAFGSTYVRPVFAIMNPMLTTTLPPYQTSCGIVDIIMHTFERYFTNTTKAELTASLAEALLKTVMHQAHIALAEPNNYDARAEIMWAGSLSHNDLTGCGIVDDWATHRIEHELSALYSVAHGAGLSSVWGSWARYVYKANTDKFVEFATNVVGIRPDLYDKERTAIEGIVAMEKFFTSINMPISISELGIIPTETELQLMAKKSAAAGGGTQGNLVKLSEQDILKIYRMAL